MTQQTYELPVDKADRLQREAAQSEHVKQSEERMTSGETISDDSPLNENQRQKILASEAIVRKTLAVFGLNYDQLIAMNNNSLYAQAVAANPGLLQAVLHAKDPVIEALKIAVGYQPFAEFKAKYGDDPKSVKQKMREEILAELRAQNSETPKQVPSDFGAMSSKKTAKTQLKSADLNEIFKNR